MQLAGAFLSISGIESYIVSLVGPCLLPNSHFVLSGISTYARNTLPGGAHRDVLGAALCRAGQVAVPDERRGALLNRLLNRLRFEFDEAVLLEVLVAFLLLHRVVAGLVGGEAALLVAVFAVDLRVVLGLLDHHHLVDAALAGRGDGADVKRDVGSRTLSATAIVKPNNVWRKF